MKKINVLFVHPIKEFSGSLRSMEEYLNLLKKNYKFTFLVPKGVASKRLTKYGKVISVIGLSKFDNSQLGYYKNLRWILILREIFFLIPTLYAIFCIKKKIKKIDTIHFNEITLIPTIILFNFFFSVPFILHCRILFKRDNFFGNKISNFLKNSIFQIIAIDNDVKNSLPKMLNVKIVRNIFIKTKIKKKNIIKNDEYLKIGYIGSFLKYKGIEDLIYAVDSLVKNKYKIKLYLAGNFIKIFSILNFFKISNNIDKDLLKKKHIISLGHINKLDKFFNKIHVLCFPSYLNALGRQVFEAGLYNIPSIVCIKNNKSDSFVNRKTGISFKNPGSIKQLKDKINYFYHNRSQISKMGKNAKKLILKNYSVKENLNKIIKIYKSAQKLSSNI